MIHEKESWHLDKRVPIALILAMAVQFGGVIAYVTSINSVTVNNERRITALEAQRIGERIAALESQVTDAKILLGRVDQKLDRLVERR